MSATFSSAILSGRSNIVIEGAGTRFQDHERHAGVDARFSTRIKQREHEGYEYEAAEASMALLIRGILDHNPELLFTVDKYHVSMRRDAKQSICEATVRVRVGKKVHDEVAEGDGPVNALDCALRACAGQVVSQAEKDHAHRLQGAHPRRRRRHGGENARAHRIHRRQARMGHRRREREHHRSQPCRRWWTRWNTRC